TGSVPEICAYLPEQLQPGDWILVKGSRGMKMERVVEALTAWANKGSEDEAR
nr:hypothetical protein [Desulfobacterales bacterium]